MCRIRGAKLLCLFLLPLAPVLMADAQATGPASTGTTPDAKTATVLCVQTDKSAFFSSASSCSTKIPRVALGDFVLITFDRPWTDVVAMAKPTPANKIGLYLNNLFMKGLDPIPVPDRNSVMFQLKRNSDNRDAWSVMFGRKNFGEPHAPGVCSPDEQIQLAVGLQDSSWTAAGSSTLCLKYLPDWGAKVALALSFIIVVGVAILAVKSSMLRDGKPLSGNKLGTYSMGRCQMALWFATVVFAFLFTYAVTGDISPIPQGTLILMGIGAGTALGAAAIDQNKSGATNADLQNWTSQKQTLDGHVQDLKTRIAALPANDPALPSLQQQLATAQQQLTDVAGKLAQSAVQIAPSEGFLKDVLTDVNGVSFHRLQVFGWTMVFWIIFISALFKSITMTDFDTTQLALMGISGSTYLGFKLQEKQS